MALHRNKPSAALISRSHTITLVSRSHTKCGECGVGGGGGGSCRGEWATVAVLIDVHSLHRDTYPGSGHTPVGGGEMVRGGDEG